MSTLSTQSWFMYFANILKALSGSSAQTAATVAGTTMMSSSASVGLGITTDAGEAFKAISAIATLVQQRDKELNTPEMVQAATAQKLQDLRDHASAVVDHAEQTGDLTQVRLLLS